MYILIPYNRNKQNIIKSNYIAWPISSLSLATSSRSNISLSLISLGEIIFNKAFPLSMIIYEYFPKPLSLK